MEAGDSLLVPYIKIYVVFISPIKLSPFCTELMTEVAPEKINNHLLTLLVLHRVDAAPSPVVRPAGQETPPGPSGGSGQEKSQPAPPPSLREVHMNNNFKKRDEI